MTRAGRGTALIALAVVGLTITGVLYLRPTLGGWLGRAHPTPGVQPPGVGVYSADFVTAQKGWILAGDASAPNRTVLKTTDAGRHWQRVAQLANITFWLHFFDARTGLAMTGTRWPSPGTPGFQLYRTDDGGASWSSFPLPFPEFEPSPGARFTIGQPFFSDPDHGWYSLTNLTGPGFDLYHTEDGGRSWSRVSSGSLAQPSGPAGANNFVSSMSFHDQRTGWMVVENVLLPNGPASSSIYATSDGGQTWGEQHLPGPTGEPDARLQQADVPAFLPDGSAVIYANLAIGGRQEAYAYPSSDGGHSWGAARQLPAGSFGRTGGVARLAFSDSRNWFDGAGSVLWVTHDAGAHWRQLARLDKNSFFVAIQTFPTGRLWATVQQLLVCGSDSVCISSPPPRLLTSTDGGRHWTKVDLPQKR